MPSSGVQTCALDRKSTRLNSSHTIISYAVFCLKKNDEPNPWIVNDAAEVAAALLEPVLVRDHSGFRAAGDTDVRIVFFLFLDVTRNPIVHALFLKPGSRL